MKFLQKMFMLALLIIPTFAYADCDPGYEQVGSECIAREYTVTFKHYFDYNAVVSKTITVTYGEPMPTLDEIPKWQERIFKGYYGPDDTRYYNADGTSAHNWDRTEDTELTIRWMEIYGTLHYNCDTMVPANLTTRFITCLDPTYAASDYNANTCQGYIFDGWYSDTDLTIPATMVCNDDEYVHWYAKWTPILSADDSEIPSNWPFSLKTTNTNNFNFVLSAQGTFYVDWGDGNIQKIVKNDTAPRHYYHTYTTTDKHAIRFAGNVTNYNTTTPGLTTIAFGARYPQHVYGIWNFVSSANSSNASCITEINGRLGEIFHTLENGTQPVFVDTFANQTELATIPDTLFNDVVGAPVDYMFANTFYNSGLEDIPEGLFSGISGDATHQLFESTFSQTKITSIPATLFAGISGDAKPFMFEQTFEGCTQLTKIPAGLFDSFVNAHPAFGMFQLTFSHSGLTDPLPDGLFSGFVGEPVEYMFSGTFFQCESLKGPLPNGLFTGISGDVANMASAFNMTFGECKSLTGGLPTTMFGNLYGTLPTIPTTPNQNDQHPPLPIFGDMFWRSTNFWCGATNNYVPFEWFSGIEGFGAVGDMENFAQMFWGTTTSSCPTPGIGTDNTPGVNRTASLGISNLFRRATSLGRISTTGATRTASSDASTDDSDSECPTGKIPVLPPHETFGAVVCREPGGACTTADNPLVCVNISGGTGIYQCIDGHWASDCTITCNNGCQPIDGGCPATCEPQYKFAVITTPLNTNDTFKFKLSASGEFTVDCDGGRLSGTGVATNTITKANTNEVQYTCGGYTSAGPHTITFDGRATGYNTSDTTATISFLDNASKIAGISGSLGAMFPTLTTSTTSQKQPRFFYTFTGANNMAGKLPENLFKGITGTPVKNMFFAMFQNCTNLSGFDDGFSFGSLSGNAAHGMFQSTFSGCSGLTGKIPSDIFGNMSGTAPDMFYDTFKDCRGLTGFETDFTFGNFTGNATNRMFANTFSGCSGLIGEIPADLFGNFNGNTASEMFAYTFKDCIKITGFDNDFKFGSFIGAPSQNMFGGTFSGCSGLRGYIPYELFAGITGVGTSSSVTGFEHTFYDVNNLDPNCPNGTHSVPTPDTTWGNRPFCADGDDPNNPNTPTECDGLLDNNNQCLICDKSDDGTGWLQMNAGQCTLTCNDGYVPW